MKPTVLSLAASSLLLASSTGAFVVNQPAPSTTFVATSSRSALFAKAKAAKAAASKEEDLELTRKLILEKMGGGAPAKVEDAPPAPAPAASKKEPEAPSEE